MTNLPLDHKTVIVLFLETAWRLKNMYFMKAYRSIEEAVKGIANWGWLHDHAHPVRGKGNGLIELCKHGFDRWRFPAVFLLTSFHASEDLAEWAWHRAEKQWLRKRRQLFFLEN